MSVTIPTPISSTTSIVTSLSLIFIEPFVNCSDAVTKVEFELMFVTGMVDIGGGVD